MRGGGGGPNGHDLLFSFNSVNSNFVSLQHSKVENGSLSIIYYVYFAGLG